MKFLILQLSFIFVLLIPSAHANITPPEFNHYCQGAQNTADMMVCAQKQNEIAQTHLQTLFEELVSKANTDKMQTMRIIQNSWITYRDLECREQVSTVETESLKRLTSLQCITSLTQKRTNTLRSAYNNETITQEDTNTLPRWMNVVANDYSDVFWRYQNALSTDLNCDKHPEEIISGVKYDASGNQAVVAIASNPTTGRPQTTLLPFILSNESTDDQHKMCDPAITFTVKKNEDALQTCNTMLEIKAKDCGHYTLYWDGQTYAIKPFKNEKKSAAKKE